MGLLDISQEACGSMALLGFFNYVSIYINKTYYLKKKKIMFPKIESLGFALRTSLSKKSVLSNLGIDYKCRQRKKESKLLNLFVGAISPLLFLSR